MTEEEEREEATAREDKRMVNDRTRRRRRGERGEGGREGGSDRSRSLSLPLSLSVEA